MQPDGLRRYTPTLSGDTLLMCVSLDSALSKHVGDALTNLTREDEWLQDGSTVVDVVEAAKITVEDYYNQMLVGSVLPWLVTPPTGWLLLDGSTYALADYPELADVLPSHLISSPNFTLPDVETAFPYGVVDEDDGSAIAGDHTFTLTVGQLPAHTHTYNNPVTGVETIGAGAPAPSVVSTSPSTPTSSVGSGDDIDKRPKRFGLLYAVFAGRNG